MVNKVDKDDKISKSSAASIALWGIYYGFAMLFGTWFAFYDSYGLPTAAWNFITIQHVLILISAFVTGLLLRGRALKTAGRIASALLCLLLLLATVISELASNPIYAAALGITFGVMCYDVLYLFAFSLTPREKLLACVISNALLCAIGFIPAAYGRQSKEFFITVTVFAFITALTGIFAKPAYDRTPYAARPPKLSRALKGTIILGLVGGIFSTGGVIISMNTLTAGGLAHAHYCFYGAGLIAAVIYYVIGRFTKEPLILGLNLTFACTVIGVLGTLLGDEIWRSVAAASCGAAFVMGMLSVYSGVGELAARFKNRKYLVIAVAIIGVAGGAGAPVLLNFSLLTFGKIAAVIAAAISAAAMLTLLVSSPFIYGKLMLRVPEEKESAGDADASGQKAAEEKPDITEALRGYGLSKRELEAALLLLKGMTIQQIATELNIRYSTVNTYCTAIYRKCGINSRTELILKFK